MPIIKHDLSRSRRVHQFNPTNGINKGRTGYGALFSGKGIVGLEPEKYENKRKWLKGTQASLRKFFGLMDKDPEPLVEGGPAAENGKQGNGASKTPKKWNTAGDLLAGTFLRETRQGVKNATPYREDVKKGRIPKLGLFRNVKRLCVATIGKLHYNTYGKVTAWQHVEMRNGTGMGATKIDDDATLRENQGKALFVAKKGVDSKWAMKHIGNNIIYVSVIYAGRKELAVKNWYGNVVKTRFLERLAQELNALKGLEMRNVKPLDKLDNSWLALKGEAVPEIPSIGCNGEAGFLEKFGITVVFEKFRSTGKRLLADTYVEIVCSIKESDLVKHAKGEGKTPQAFLGKCINAAHRKAGLAVDGSLFPNKYELVLFNAEPKAERKSAEPAEKEPEKAAENQETPAEKQPVPAESKPAATVEKQEAPEAEKQEAPKEETPEPAATRNMTEALFGKGISFRDMEPYRPETKKPPSAA